jgi:hypothetical protein
MAMNKVEECIVRWTLQCNDHYSKYKKLRTVVCNGPLDILKEMLAGYWQRVCTSDGSCYGSDYFDNVAFNIIGYRQLANKITDISILPDTCSLDEDCLVSLQNLKLNLTSCAHGAYANDASGTSVSINLMIFICIINLLFYIL